MKFETKRETLLEPLQAVQGIVDRRSTLPILANVLVTCDAGGGMTITATDHETQHAAILTVENGVSGATTIPFHKLQDICKALPEGAHVKVSCGKKQANITAGRSRFKLNVMDADDFPLLEEPAPKTVVGMTLPRDDLKGVLDIVAHAMAKQDTRYYLNGALLEIKGGKLRAVATDGHCVAIADVQVGLDLHGGGEVKSRNIIVPRRAVNELRRILGDGDELVDVKASESQIRVDLPDMHFASRLINGKYPDYRRVVPKVKECDKRVTVSREELQQCLSRVSILSNWKYRMVTLAPESEKMRVFAANHEAEEAQDDIAVEYTGAEAGLEISFDVKLLLNALGAMSSETIRIYLTDAESSALILPETGEAIREVVMPIRP